MFRRIAHAIVPGPIRQWLQRRKLERLASSFPSRIVQHRYGDVELRVELTDPLAAGWYDRDWDTLPEFAVLARSRLQSGARVFDCGAHQGVVGMMLGKHVGSTGQVVLVEASPHNAEMCRRNLALNEMHWLAVEQAAISDAEGQLKFNSGWNGAVGAVSDFGGLIDVPATTIDALALRYGPPDVVFVDVEGYEHHALRGAQRTRSLDTDWFVEIHVGAGLEAAGASVADVLDCFPASQYVRFVHQESWRESVPLESAPPEVFKSRFFLTALKSPNSGNR